MKTIKEIEDKLYKTFNIYKSSKECNCEVCNFARSSVEFYRKEIEGMLEGLNLKYKTGKHSIGFNDAVEIIREKIEQIRGDLLWET